MTDHPTSGPRKVYGLDGSDITRVDRFEYYYEPHVEETAQALRVALGACRHYLLNAGGILAESVGEMYILGLEVDGQYHTFSIGVSNLTTLSVEVDATTGKAGPVSR